MLHKICLFSAIALVVLLTGCSTFSGKQGYFRDRTQSYLSAKSTAPLTFPAGTEPQGLQADYPVPDVAPNAEQTEPVNTLPPDLLNKKS